MLLSALWCIKHDLSALKLQLADKLLFPLLFKHDLSALKLQLTDKLLFPLLFLSEKTVAPNIKLFCNKEKTTIKKIFPVSSPK